MSAPLSLPGQRSFCTARTASWEFRDAGDRATRVAPKRKPRHRAGASESPQAVAADYLVKVISCNSELLMTSRYSARLPLSSCIWAMDFFFHARYSSVRLRPSAPETTLSVIVTRYLSGSPARGYAFETRRRNPHRGLAPGRHRSSGREFLEPALSTMSEIPGHAPGILGRSVGAFDACYILRGRHHAPAGRAGLCAAAGLDDTGQSTESSQ